MASAALLLYRVLLRGGLAAAAPLLWVRDRATGKARPSLAARLGRALPPVRPGGLWIQAVSVGEVEAARRLIGELERTAPELPLFLTATTATGLGLARKIVGDRIPIQPCPLDLGRPVRRVLDHARPRGLALVETELWPELLHAAGERKVAVAVVNGRLSERSFARYRTVRPLLGPLLRPLTMVLARAEADAARFAALGVPESRITVTGNVKYDLEPDPRPLAWSDRLGEWAAGRPVIVAGSTMDGEEAAVLDAVAAAGGGDRQFLVLAPRHPERFEEVARLLADSGLGFVRRSAIDAVSPTPDVLLLDAMGELGRAYRGALAAFVGGSLVPTGGHNPLEPAVWGVPVLTGPHVHNFREVYDEMAAAGAARVVEDSGELAAVLAAWIAEPEAAAARGAAGRAVVESNRGATARTASALLEMIEGLGD